MRIHFTLNGTVRQFDCEPGDSLLTLLRRAEIWSVKHGCETGECGACSVLIDGVLTPTCVMLAAQAEGHSLVTVEGLATGQQIHPLQQAFIDTGAIQCGYCTPAMLLAAKALLDRNPRPTEADARAVLGGVMCRCTGYVKPVEAILRAAALLRGETPPLKEQAPTATRVVGHPEPKVDAVRLVKGRPVFTDDMHLPGLLHAALLTSPHAHARIRAIDVERARSLPGVHAVLTYRDVPRVVYESGGQSYPNPLPYDQVSLDSKVRHVGDRVAVVAAETPDIARAALDLIRVDYEVLPAVFDPDVAQQPGAPVIHDEADAVKIEDAQHNLATSVHAQVGDVEKGLRESDRVFERTYYTSQVQQAHLEPHVCLTYWDEDDRLIVRSSTQVPFHTRRSLACR